MILNHLAAIGVLLAVFLFANGPRSKKKKSIKDPTLDCWHDDCYSDKYIWHKRA